MIAFLLQALVWLLWTLAAVVAAVGIYAVWFICTVGNRPYVCSCLHCCHERQRSGKAYP